MSIWPEKNRKSGICGGIDWEEKLFFTMIESAILIGTVKKEKIWTESRSEDFFDIDLLGDIWIAMILNT